MHEQLNSSSHNSKATNQLATFHVASFHNKLFQWVVTNVARKLLNKKSKQQLEMETSKEHKKFQWNLQA
jgi:hypothetical protein